MFGRTMDAQRRVTGPVRSGTHHRDQRESPKIRGEVLSLNNPAPIELIFLHWWGLWNELDGETWRASSLAFWGTCRMGKDVHPPDLSVNQRHHDKRTLNSGRVSDTNQRRVELV